MARRLNQGRRLWWRWLGAIAILAVVLGGWMPGERPGAIAPAVAQMPATNTELHWYGQSAFKIVTPTGRVLLIDPWVNNPGNPNGEADLANLDRADLVLITHGHGDHVGDAAAIGAKTQAPLVTTYDLGRALAATGGYPEPLVSMATQGNFGGEIELLDGDVSVAFVPAVHSSAVGTDGKPAAYAGNPGGFVIHVKDGPRIYHTGDTDVFADMSYISQFGAIDVMLACIGGKFTMGPDRAAEAVRLVQPTMVVPMHFGLFGLPGTPEQFATALEAQGIGAELRVMEVGETLNL